jgi:hypothetical protein
VGEREQPRIALSAQQSAETISVTISASGSGLKSDEDMLVQLQAIETFPDRSEPACGRSRFESYRPGDEPVWPGPLLLWEQAGPDAKGAVAVESVLDVPPGRYDGVCAFVALRGGGSAPRAVTGYLRFRDV